MVLDRRLDYRSRRHFVLFLQILRHRSSLRCAPFGSKGLGATSAYAVPCRLIQTTTRVMLTKCSFSLFFLSSDLLLIPRPPVRNPLSTWENRQSKFDYAFGSSLFHPRPYPHSFVCFALVHPFNGPGYTLEGLFISGTRLNNLDGDHITTSCTPPFHMLDDRSGRHLLLIYLSASATTFPGA